MVYLDGYYHVFFGFLAGIFHQAMFDYPKKHMFD